MNTPAHTTAPENPSAADIAARVLEGISNLAATWATSGNRHAARDNLVMSVGFALMRDAFAGTDAANAGFDLVDAVEQLAKMANHMSFIDPDAHFIEATDMADQVAQAAYKVAADLAKAWGAM